MNFSRDYEADLAVGVKKWFCEDSGPSIVSGYAATTVTDDKKCSWDVPFQVQSQEGLHCFGKIIFWQLE